MKLQEGGCGITGTLSDFVGVRSIGDAEQQADLQIARAARRIAWQVLQDVL